MQMKWQNSVDPDRLVPLGGSWCTLFAKTFLKLLQQSISELEFYGDLDYRIRKIMGKSKFSEQFRKFMNSYKRIGYNHFQTDISR